MFTINVNCTVFAEHGQSGLLLSLQSTLDAAIIQSRMSASSITSILSVNPFDVKASGSDVTTSFPTISLFGPALIAIGMTIQAMLAMQFVIDEKEASLVMTMRRSGLLQSAYWFSWILSYALLSLLSSLLATAVGSFCDIYAFSQSAPGVQILLLFLFSLSMTSLMIAISSPVPFGAINFLKFTVLAFATFFCLFESLLDDWQDEEDPTFSILGSIFFGIFPFFQYGRALNIILETTHHKGYMLGENETMGYASEASRRRSATY
mgnify:CR=1 FL=1